MDWRVKATVQRVLGHVPGGDTLHYWLQGRVGGLRRFEYECDAKVDDWRLMARHLRNAGVAVAGTRFVEIGTGWYPTFPCCLFLAGAARIATLDLTPKLRPELTLAMAERLLFHLPLVAEVAGRPLQEVSVAHAALVGALRAGASVVQATSGVVSVDAPADARRTSTPPGCVDVVFSNSVLEHVEASVIPGMFAEAMRVLRPGGLMFHSVNCGDHYAYVDPRINQLHYLRYSEKAWRKWNNRFLYQNRLRAVDFTRMARSAGFTIEVDTSNASPERLRQLDGLTVDPGFRRYEREELAPTSIDFVARKTLVPSVEPPWPSPH